VRRALAAALCIAAAGCADSSLSSEAPPAAGTWVPFEGEFRSVAAGVESRGRVFRRRDGSFRKETLDAVGVPSFVTIENRAQKRFYSFSSGSWTAQPWSRTPTAPPGRDRYPNAAIEADRVAGLRVVRWVSGFGVTTLRAPELDYYPLVEEHGYPPLRIEHVRVVRADPPDGMFEPPAGSRVDELPWQYEGTVDR
jgi:hypothetical protein